MRSSVLFTEDAEKLRTKNKGKLSAPLLRSLQIAVLASKPPSKLHFSLFPLTLKRCS